MRVEIVAMQLVRRPGGMTAWVTNVENPATANSVASPSQTTDLLTPLDADTGAVAPVHIQSTVSPLPMSGSPFVRGLKSHERRSRRTRHSSLDLDEKADIVLWDPNHTPSRWASILGI